MGYRRIGYMIKKLVACIAGLATLVAPAAACFGFPFGGFGFPFGFSSFSSSFAFSSMFSSMFSGFGSPFWW